MNKLVYQLLDDLVAMQTVTGDFAANDAALDYISHFLEARGMYIYRTKYDGYGALVATTQQTKCPAVMLVGHIDVVPASSSRGYTAEEREGRLYGRGTRDMKGAIAAYMAVADELQANLSEYDFGILLISDEETVDVGIIKLLGEGFLPKSVVLLDGGESWCLEKFAKGALYIAVKASGTSAHGSRPWEGDSASFKLIAFLNELRQDFAGHGAETNTLNIAQLRAGSSAYNQIPDTAEAMLDIRLISRTSKTAIAARLSELGKKHDATVEEVVYFPVLEHDITNPYLASFSDSITKITGEAHPPTIAYGASDACRFNELGIPCAVTYPMGGGHHSDKEWIGKKAQADLVLILLDHLEKTGRVKQRSSAKQSVGA